MGKISKHFSRTEMACGCGCGLDSMDAETLLIADEIRDYVGAPITPSSAARCYEYNRHIGSEDTSQHPKCRAMDLPVLDPVDVYNWLCKKYPGKYGFGVYQTFIHIDTRTNGPARWNRQ